MAEHDARALVVRGSEHTGFEDAFATSRGSVLCTATHAYFWPRTARGSHLAEQASLLVCRPLDLSFRTTAGPLPDRALAETTGSVTFTRSPVD
jgi:hypothetical protein